MIKILHSADWHLDAPMSGHSEAQTEYLRRELKKVPEKLAQLCAAEHCDLVFLAGDLFDGPWSADTLRTVQEALRTMAVPVFIAPGNHDPMGKDSPYTQPSWPENVHIFTQAQMTSVVLPELDCRIYGAGYEGMDCPALLENFQAQGTETWQLGILHGDPTVSASPLLPHFPAAAAQLRTALSGTGSHPQGRQPAGRRYLLRMARLSHGTGL